MPELTSQERLQPALLDRLTDDAPDRKQEPPEARVITASRLRAGVLRDLSWLLNTVRPRDSELPAGLTHAAEGVLWYGLPPMTGETLSTVDAVALKQAIRETIERFEPRLLKDTLEVEVFGSPGRLESHNIIGLEVRGRLWAQPVPLEILLRTEIDLEDGSCEVRETSRTLHPQAASGQHGS
jgi:type VI secretion system protein ImpF